MTTKNTHGKTVHDLRDLVPVKLALPDVSSEYVGVLPRPKDDVPNIDSPSIGNEPPGQATHD
jgi:hypothetical protein